MASRFSDWGNNHFTEFVAILDNFRKFKNDDEMKKFVYALMSIEDKKEYFIDRAIKILVPFPHLNNIHNIERNRSRIKTWHVKPILEDNTISEYNRAKLAHEILRVSDPFVLQKSGTPNLIEVILNLFRSYLDKSEKNSFKTESFLLLNVSNIVDNRIILTPEACQYYMEFLLKAEENLNYFIQHFFRSKYQPPMSNQFVFHPFFQQIFPEGELKTIASSINTTNERTLGLIKIIKKYYDKIDDDNTFTATPGEYHFLIRHMKETGQVPQNTDEEGLSESKLALQ